MAKKRVVFEGLPKIFKRINRLSTRLPKSVEQGFVECAEGVSKIASNYLYTQSGIAGHKSLTQAEREAYGQTSHKDIREAWEWDEDHKVSINKVEVPLVNTSEHAYAQEFGIEGPIKAKSSAGMTFWYRGKWYFHVQETSGIPPIGFLEHAINHQAWDMRETMEDHFERFIINNTEKVKK